MKKNTKNVTKKGTEKNAKKDAKTALLSFKIPGIDKIDYHVATGRFNIRKGKRTASANAFVVRVRKDGVWYSAFEVIRDIMEKKSTEIKRENLKEINIIAGQFKDICGARAAVYFAHRAFGVPMTAEKEAEGAKHVAAYERELLKNKKAKIEEMFKIVKAGKIEYIDAAKKEASERFDKIAERVAKIQNAKK